MAHQVKNEGNRRIAVNTPGGIHTVGPGKTGTFKEILNLQVLEGMEKVKVKTTTEEPKAAAKEPAKTPAGPPSAPKA